MPNQIPDGFKTFLISKIYQVPAVPQELDHMIQRSLALYRLLWSDIPDGFQMVDERLKEVAGKNWREDFERRNREVVRTTNKTEEEKVEDED